MAEFNDMQQIKRRFFAMRNGALAEQMRRQGAPYQIIFGLNLPQLTEISRDVEPSADLAERLWANTTTRESLLLAPMVYPKDEMTLSVALQWATSCPTAEVADILCHRLLRQLPFANEIVDALADAERNLDRYVSLRLRLNLFPSRLEEARMAAETELGRDCRLTQGVARQIIDEVRCIADME